MFRTFLARAASVRLHPRILGAYPLPHLPVKLIEDRFNREDPNTVNWKWSVGAGVVALSDAVDNDGDGDGNDNNNANDLTCDKCFHKFCDLGTYNRHVKTNKSCKRKRNNKDDSSASKKPKYECNICSTSFSSLSNFNQHK